MQTYKHVGVLVCSLLNLLFEKRSLQPCRRLPVEYLIIKAEVE